MHDNTEASITIKTKIILKLLISPNVLVNEEKKGGEDGKRQNEMSFLIMRQNKLKNMIPFLSLKD